MHYDAEFFESINAGSTASARRLLPLVLELLEVATVCDFGCGQGAWLAVWQEHGAGVQGIDGHYVDTDQLLIDPDHFQSFDLAQSVDLGRRFDLVQSLEVAEHIPPSQADVFLENLVRHGDAVLFSAAVPGQGGTNHINEQPLEWWRARFAAHGYLALDPFREPLLAMDDVRPWYQYNVILYVSEAKLAASPALEAHVVPSHVPLPDVSPALYQLRKRLLAPLPIWVINGLARAKIWMVGGRSDRAADRLHRL